MTIKTIPVKFWSSASEGEPKAVPTYKKVKPNQSPTNKVNEK